MSSPSTILIVEDEVSLCKSLKVFLSSHTSEITTAYTGKEAIELIANSHFDLILLDMILPDMTGDQVIEYVKSQNINSLVVVMTAYVSTDSAIESFRKGAYDYLKKPFQLDELLTTVENALNYKKSEDLRKCTEEALQKAHDELERRVEERTAELSKANEKLQREIQKRKGVEEELRHAHDELEQRIKQRTAELVKANEELRTEIAERKRLAEALRNSSEKFKLFAYSLIHDLRSPAVGIYGLTKLLHQRYRESLDETGRKYCEQIVKAAEHVAVLTDKINVYLATKEDRLQIESVKVKEILQLVKEEFSARMDLRRIRWVEPATIPEVRADRLSLVRAYRNFVDNALKHGGSDLTEILIDYKESQDLHIFSVSDNGAGMRGADFQTIFSEFHRNGAPDLVEGAGLGLAIVREIAERHGGQVWAEPRPQGGTTFYMSLAKNV